VKSITVVRDRLLADAAALRERREALSPEDGDRFWLGVAEAGAYVLYGMMIGVCVGYVSHIVADLGTPKSIPVISRTLG
jgi:hypothetical protein